MTIWHLLATFFGINAPGSPWYNWWSGFGSDLGEFAIAGAIWHHLNCPVKGCWRIARRVVPGTDHKVCGRHHPLIAPEARDVHADYENAKR